MISVIIPIYNAEKTLENCVRSILQQSFTDLQIILVDDGSKDSSGTMVDRFSEMDSRVIAIHQKNKGASIARNSGLKVSAGEWIAFVDADDYLEADYFEIMEKCIQGNDEIDVVISNGAKNKSGNYSKQMRYIKSESKSDLKFACLAYDEEKFSFNIDAPWGKIFRASVIRNNHIQFPERLVRSEDAVFCVTVYETCKKIVQVDYAGYIHVESEGSLCRKYAPNAKNILLDILHIEKEWVDKYHAKEDYYQKALWYRILPGINECEQVWLFHANNRKRISGKISDYHMLLREPIIKDAIKRLKLKDVEFTPYKRRLLLYKLHMGWILILAKCLFRK